MIESRVLDPADADVEVMLTRMHAMSEENYRSWWACANPPYPSRNEMTKMLNSDHGKFVVLTENDVVVAWDFFGHDGSILAGGVKHDPVTNGYTAEIEPSAIEYQRKMNEVIIAETGHVYHLAVGNPRMWFALEVRVGIPIHPNYAHYGLPPHEAPPLPEEAIRAD